MSIRPGIAARIAQSAALFGLALCCSCQVSMSMKSTPTNPVGHPALPSSRAEQQQPPAASVSKTAVVQWMTESPVSESPVPATTRRRGTIAKSQRTDAQLSRRTFRLHSDFDRYNSR